MARFVIRAWLDKRKRMKLVKELAEGETTG
jgi:hypothetical protein